MSLIPVENVGQLGIVKDQSPWQIPLNAWSNGNNVKTDEGSIKKALGYSSVMTTVPIAPYFIIHIVSGVAEFWVIGGTAAIHVYDNTKKANLLNGAIDISETTLTVDSTTNFQSKGTVTIDSEQITYTGKTATTFTGCTRAANSTSAATHDDNAVVTRTKKWYDITRSSSAYSMDTEENWSGTVIGGVLVMTNGTDKPQYWALVDGVPESTQLMQDLNDWPSTTLLNGALNDSATTVTVDSTASFPVSGTFTVDSEDISYTGRTATTFTGCTRGANSTSEAAHDDNATAYVSVTCNAMKAFRSFLIGLKVSKAGISYPRLVKWSTEAGIQTTPTSWDETLATVDAGEFELADTKGDILDGLQLRDTFMIYKEDSTYAVTFIGTPFIFSFRQISPTIGAIAKNCVVEFPGGHAFLGNGDFYVNDGRTLKPILPSKLRKYVFSTIDGEELDKCFVVADYGRSEILFCFSADGGVTTQTDEAIVWNYNANTFTIRSLPGLGHIGYGSITDPAVETTWAAATTTWETVSGVWTMSYSVVEDVLVFASAENTKIYRDNSGYQEDGSNMTSYVERTGIALNEQGQEDHTTVKNITAIYPKINIDSANTINVRLATQMSTEDTISWGDPVAFNPDSQSKVSVRGSGRFYGVKFESTTDMDWKLAGYSFEVQNAGRRGTRGYG